MENCTPDKVYARMSAEEEKKRVAHAQVLKRLVVHVEEFLLQHLPQSGLDFPIAITCDDIGSFARVHNPTFDDLGDALWEVLRKLNRHDPASKMEYVIVERVKTPTNGRFTIEIRVKENDH